MADWTVDVARSLDSEAKKAIVRACVECTNDLKKFVSIPAPRRIAKGSGRVYARTKAFPGAPPRKLTGRGRASITYQISPNGKVGYVGTNVFYMEVHELKNHEWVKPVMTMNSAKYNAILAGKA